MNKKKFLLLLLLGITKYPPGSLSASTVVGRRVCSQLPSHSVCGHSRSSHGVCGSFVDRRPSSRQTTIVVPTKVAWCVPSLTHIRRVPVEGKSSVCLICMKYRIIILIIVIISLGKNIIIVYCKHITHARMDGRTHAHTHPHAHPTHDRRCSLSLCAQPCLRHGWALLFRRWRDNGRSDTAVTSVMLHNIVFESSCV